MRIPMKNDCKLCTLIRSRNIIRAFKIVKKLSRASIEHNEKFVEKLLKWNERNVEYGLIKTLC